MSTEEFLSRLQKVRKTGPRNWIASCPAHEDSNPSLTVLEDAEGKTVFNCKAGCTQEAVQQASGLHWSAFFPVDWAGRKFKPAPRFPAADVLAALADEAMLVAVAASNIASGVELTAEDRKRLITACARIQRATELALGRR